MSKGFLIYAHNNEEVDYGKIALVCSLMIKANLKENDVCLVTDQGTLDWMNKSLDADLMKQAFNHVKVLDYGFKRESRQRQFLDTKSTVKHLTWHNGTRSTAYELTPYDETIILDSDVLVQDGMFDLVWGNDEEVLINREALTLLHTPPRDSERRLDSMSIPMYWATMVYFRKSERAEILFDLIEHIKDNYEYYQYAYEFPGKLYRNDYVFSIAIHMLNGFLENDEFKPFPQSKILSSFDVDDIVRVGKNELTFLAQDQHESWRFLLSRVKGVTVHTMNKYAILRHADELIELYRK